MRFFGKKDSLNKFIFFLFITIGSAVLLVTWQMSGKNDLNVEKVVLTFDENDDFTLEPYVDCLYEVNKDISNKCIESEIKSLIDRGEASKALHLIKALDTNKEKFLVNCPYLAERIGKVFNNITDIESLLLIDFEYCNYGFQIGVFGEIDKGFLKDKNMLSLIKQSCNKYIIEGQNKDKESGACHKGIANILTSTPSKLGPLESRDFCLAIEDPEGVCLSNLLKNYVGKGSSKSSKGLFANKDKVVETLLNFCKSEAVDNTKNCLTGAITNIFAHNEKLVYLIADYCAKVKLDISKSCYREIAKGFNIATESAYIKENSDPGLAGEAIYQDSYENLVDKTQIFKIFTENLPKYCNFLDDVVELNKEYVDQCYIGFALVLLQYYELDEKEVCKYFNKTEYGLCKVGIKINKGKSIDDKYKVA
jgi:hypothetical protein